MLRKHLNIVMIVLLLVLLAACNKKSDIPSLVETYSKKDKNPFGASVFYDGLLHLFVHNSIETAVTKFSTTASLQAYKNALYVNVSKRFYLNTLDVEAFFSFIVNGNTAFVSSETIDTAILKKIAITAAENKNYYEGLIPFMQLTHVQLDSVLAIPTYNNQYQFFYNALDHHFDSVNQQTTTILGYSNDGMPNFVVLNIGQGRLYLHCEPKVFSNYFLLNNNNIQYLQQAFSFMPNYPTAIIWDDYYSKHANKVDENATTGLGVLLKYPAMKWAFFIFIAMVILYIIFDGKRKQRIVPVIPAVENTSVLFTQTIARLYLQEKNNRNIADKMIAYFYEYLRNQLYVQTNDISPAFLTNVSKKAAVPNELTIQLFNTIQHIQKASNVSDEQLLELNGLIEKFYKINT